MLAGSDQKPNTAARRRCYEKPLSWAYTPTRTSELMATKEQRSHRQIQPAPATTMCTLVITLKIAPQRAYVFTLYIVVCSIYSTIYLYATRIRFQEGWLIDERVVSDIRLAPSLAALVELFGVINVRAEKFSNVSITRRQWPTHFARCGCRCADQRACHISRETKVRFILWKDITHLNCA